MDGWQNYPWNHPSYIQYRDPSSEFGCKTILDSSLACQSDFTYYEVQGTNVVQHEYQSTMGASVDGVLTGQHGVIRIYVFKRIAFDQMGPWALTRDDACKIFHRYQMQPTMIHRLKAFKFSAEPIKQSVWCHEDTNTTDLNAKRPATYSLQYNAVIPINDSTSFAPVYHTWDRDTGQQAMLIFNDSEASLAASFEDAIVQAVKSVISKPSCLPLTRHPLALSLVICGLVTEGWTQFSCDMRAIMADMETLIEESPDIVIWDLQKVFGHLSFRHPSLLVLIELLEILKADNDKLGPDIAGNRALADQIEIRLAFLHSVGRDIDYMRKRMEDLSSLSFNLTAQVSSRHTANIANRSVQDTVSMRTIAVLTLFFLPGAYVSSLFGMTFFSTRLSAARTVWVYFAVTGPLTAVVMLSWFIWQKRERIRTKAKGFKASLKNARSPSVIHELERRQTTRLDECDGGKRGHRNSDNCTSTSPSPTRQRPQPLAATRATIARLARVVARSAKSSSSVQEQDSTSPIGQWRQDLERSFAGRTRGSSVGKGLDQEIVIEVTESLRPARTAESIYPQSIAHLTTPAITTLASLSPPKPPAAFASTTGCARGRRPRSPAPFSP